MRKTIRVVAAILVDQGRVLATQRGSGAQKDGWEVPGGKFEAGEQPREALARELREELGVRTDLVWLGWLRIDVQESFVYGGLFYGRYDGAVTMQPEEVADVIMLTEDEMLARAAEATPDSVIAFREILRRLRARE